MTTLLFSLKNIIAPENNWLQSGQASPSAENEELNGPPASMGWEARQSRQEAALRVSSRLATSGYVSSHCKFMTLETTCWCDDPLRREAWTINSWPELWQEAVAAFSDLTTLWLGSSRWRLALVTLLQRCHGWIVNQEEELTKEQKVRKK